MCRFVDPCMWGIDLGGAPPPPRRSAPALQMFQNGLIILTFVRIVSFINYSYDKRDDIDFPKVNFPYTSSDIPKSTTYGVFVSQLICYAPVCSKYEDFLFRGYIRVSKLLKQG